MVCTFNLTFILLLFNTYKELLLPQYCSNVFLVNLLKSTLIHNINVLIKKALILRVHVFFCSCLASFLFIQVVRPPAIGHYGSSGQHILLQHGQQSRSIASINGHEEPSSLRCSDLNTAEHPLFGDLSANVMFSSAEETRLFQR